MEPFICNQDVKLGNILKLHTQCLPYMGCKLYTHQYWYMYMGTKTTDISELAYFVLGRSSEIHALSITILIRNNLCIYLCFKCSLQLATNDSLVQHDVFC